MSSPFKAKEHSTVNIDVAAASARVSLAVMLLNNFPQIRVYNAGTATAWFAFGDSTVTADTADIPIGPGVIEVFTITDKTGTLYAAAIAAGATGKIYFTPGGGF